MRAIRMMILALCASVCARPIAARPLDPVLRDYLIEDVCIDAAGRPTAEDPAVCARHRDIAPGEPTPYLVTDFERGTTRAYSAMSSLPVAARDGTPLVMVAKAMNPPFDASYRFGFDMARDGYDLIDLSAPDTVSIVRTSDGGCFDQIFSRGSRYRAIADRAGGWMLFPNSAPASWPDGASRRVVTYKVQLSPNRAGCRSGSASGRTFWAGPRDTRFETGKLLRAIRSDHFANGDLGQPGNALERFYFTREYGFTRWEAWRPVAACAKAFGKGSPRCDPASPANPLRGRCSVLVATPTGQPGLDRWGGQDWVRVDCRDQTRFVALDTPQTMRAEGMARGQGVDDLPPPAPSPGLSPSAR